jgi:predicted transcriptional regulator
MELKEFSELGFDEKEIKILFALKDGPLSGPEIEKKTDLRQPEVSRAIIKLQNKNYVQFVKNEKRSLQGAPCKIWSLTKPFEEIITDIVSKKLIELDKKLRIAVSILFELGKPLDSEEFELIKKLKNTDTVIELKEN